MKMIFRPVNSFDGNRTSDALTVHRPCPVCGADAPRPVLSFNGFQFFSDAADAPKRVDVHDVRCDRCNALYLDPVYTPFGFETLFREAGCSYGATAGRVEEQRAWMADKGLLRDGATVLDVGCNRGDFLAALPEGIGKIGIDMDAPSIRAGERAHAGKNIQFILGDFDTFDLSSPPDCVTLFHVLEHLPNPVGTLARLRAIASSRTALVVEVPILENGFTNDINGFMSVQHLTHFSRASLMNSLAKAGWRVEERLEQPGYNGCRVLARPAAPRDDVMPAPKDPALLARYLDHYRAVTRAASTRLAAVNATDVVLFGGGMHTEFLYHVTDFFTRAPQRRYAILDRDPLKHGATWRGIPIYPPEAIDTVSFEETAVVVSSYGGQRAMAEALGERGVPTARVTLIYDSFRLY